jgi:sugar lactone lactonase YvrE
MNRLSILAVLFAAGLATAQDMPLSEILKPGETWHEVGQGNMPETTKVPDLKVGELPIKQPTCKALALGGSTLLVADAADRYVWAFQIQKDGKIGPGDRYCRLRVRGDQRRKNSTPEEAFRADPSAMTIDGANRTYVATNLGIQVFDPTGRLCGVFTSPPGHVTELAFDGDRLFAKAGDKVYVRQMLAEGKK